MISPLLSLAEWRATLYSLFWLDTRSAALYFIVTERAVAVGTVQSARLDDAVAMEFPTFRQIQIPG